MSEGIFKLNPWKSAMVAGIVLLLIGVLMAVFQRDSLEIILIVSGVFCILVGVFDIYEAWRASVTGIGLVPGVIYVVLGLVLVLVPGLISDILMLLLALVLVVIGAVSLLNISRGYAGNLSSHIVDIAISAIMLCLGVYALFNLDSTADIVMIVIGVFVAVAGITRIYGAYVLKQLDV